MRPGTYHHDVRWDWVLAGAAVVAFAGGGAAYVAVTSVEDPEPVVVEIMAGEPPISTGSMQVDEPAPRDIEPYRGYGTWVDVFDYVPTYAGADPAPVTVDALQEMQDLGVGTLYLQAARLDDRSPGGLQDPWVLAEIIHTAHDLGIDVVAWYLPRFGAGGADLDRITAMADFEVLGHRFDGVALDIEWVGDGIEYPVRNERLVRLSEDADAALGEDPLGAIVLTPVHLEVVNDQFWPEFPWAEIADHYEVWLPMSYWSLRTDASGYGDGYAYHEETVRRLRANIGDPDALVHGIGGIGGVDGVDDDPDPPEPVATLEEIRRFAIALADTDSIGGSLYDWNTLEPEVRRELAGLFAAE